MLLSPWAHAELPPTASPAPRAASQRILGRLGLSHPAWLHMWAPFAGGHRAGVGKSEGWLLGLGLNVST